MLKFIEDLPGWAVISFFLLVFVGGPFLCYAMQHKPNCWPDEIMIWDKQTGYACVLGHR